MLVAQNIGTWAAGGLGGGFGYAGIGNSVAICLDTYSGTSPNYIATQAWTNGNIQQISAFRVGTPITDGRIYVSASGTRRTVCSSRSPQKLRGVGSLTASFSRSLVGCPTALCRRSRGRTAVRPRLRRGRSAATATARPSRKSSAISRQLWARTARSLGSVRSLRGYDEALVIEPPACFGAVPLFFALTGASSMLRCRRRDWRLPRISRGDSVFLGW